MADLAARRTVPILVYERPDEAHDFLVDVFGLQPGGIDRDADGRAVHAEVSAGDLTIWLHRHAPEHGLTTPRALDLVSSALMVFVDDVDAHYERAVAGGAEITEEIQDAFFGYRRYQARDLDGHAWNFAEPLEHVRQRRGEQPAPG
jgi:uncharacterized glyoxalase superfamily protein PhnB